MLVIDAHQDVSTNIDILSGKNIFKLNKIHQGQNTVGLPVNNQVDIPRLQKSTLNMAFWASCPISIEKDEIKEATKPAEQTIRQIGIYKRILRKSDYLVEVSTKKKLEDFRKYSKNKFGVMLSVEGADMIDPDLYNLDVLYELGVRLIAFTWNFDNHLGQGAKSTRGRKGLSELGKASLRKMNKLGIIMDVAHLNRSSFWDALEVSQKPVLCSHTNLTRFNDHFRLLTKDQVEEIAKNAGVICLSAYSKFIDKDSNADLNDFLDQIDYIRDLVGVDYIGFGTDFDGMIRQPLTKDMEDVTCFQTILDGLRNRGYTDEQIKKIAGENIVRVIKANWIE